jgi:hypothetical protein
MLICLDVRPIENWEGFGFAGLYDLLTFDADSR